MNGKMNGWTKYLVSVLVGAVLFIALPTMASHIIANDKASRERDQSIDDKVDRAILEQKQEMKDVAVNVAMIQKDIQYLIKALDK